MIYYSMSILYVKAFKDFKGDASVAMARGKKKWLIDISFTIEWEFATDDSGGVAKGTAKFLDATCDAIDEARLGFLSAEFAIILKINAFLQYKNAIQNILQNYTNIQETLQ